MKKGNYRELVFSILFFFPVFVCAQKLPNIQKDSCRAPAGVKIDGSVAEWNNQFQAFNHSTEIFYTVANDDNYIYLIIQAKKSSIIEKLLEGGVGFTLSASGKKNDPKNVTILYPCIGMVKARDILRDAAKKLNEGNYTVHFVDPDDTAYAPKAKPSMAKANLGLSENLKEIKVSGIASVVDTVPGITPRTPYYNLLPMREHPFKVIGVTNQDNIKAKIRFDDDGTLNYELAVPIKSLNFPDGLVKKFNYGIIIHGRSEDSRIGGIVYYGPPVNGTKEILYSDLTFPTDCWGEYTLAKK